MLNYIILSLKKMFVNSKGPLALMIMAQIFSVVIIVFSYGIVNHYNTKIDEPEGYELEYNFYRNEEYDTENEKIYLTIGQIRNFYNRILPLIENKLDYFFVLGDYEDYLLQCSTGYENGKYTISTQLKERVGIRDGEGFSEDDMNSGEKCILAGEEMLGDDNYVVLGGEKYEVKGVLTNKGLSDAFFITYGAIPNDAKIISSSLLLEKPLLKSEYDAIAEALEECFGDKIIIPEFNGVINESNNRVYRDIIFVSVILIFVFAIDYCIIYRYILEKRRRIFAVSRICGGSKLKISIVYMVELLGMSFITLVVGIWIFHNGILTRVKKTFEYINLYCDMDAYIKLGYIYMTILFGVYMVLIVKFVRKTPVSLIKEV